MTGATATAKLATAAPRMTLEELWNSPAIKELTRVIRGEFQATVNEWCNQDSKPHLPVYVSLKPKLSVQGRYFYTERGRGKSIVIYPIQADSYPINPATIHVPTHDHLAETLRHEYSHHLAGGQAGHGKAFRAAQGKTRQRRA